MFPSLLTSGNSVYQANIENVTKTSQNGQCFLNYSLTAVYNGSFHIAPISGVTELLSSKKVLKLMPFLKKEWGLAAMV